MEYSKLGSTDLKVSRVCLGTMTWGNQNSEAEGHEQMELWIVIRRVADAVIEELNLCRP